MIVPYAASVGTSSTSTLQSITQALSGRLTFTDNMQGVFVSWAVTAANTPQSITLPVTLPAKPIGFIITKKDKACDVFATAADQGSWSTTLIVLEGTVATTNLTAFVF